MTQAMMVSNTLSQPATGARPAPSGFADAGLFDWLLAASAAEIDALEFGVIAMGLDGLVEHYNVAEGKLAGLTPSRVVGRNFFTSVAPCTNNHMVAERYATEPDLDAVIDYVFTLRMSPTKVRLRLMKRRDETRMFLIVERR